MSEWPTYIRRAFLHFYESGTEEEPIEEFASRWGGLDLATFTHVLDVGQGQDKIIALSALGYSGQPEARAALLPFLQSQVRMERWVSALCLGEMQEEQAFPVLQDMLLEGFFEQEVRRDPDTGEDIVWYEAYRGLVASLLARWRNPTIVSALRQALEASWKREQQVTVPVPLFPWVWYLSRYHSFQDSLAFALGNLEAGGALLYLEFPQSRLRIALIYLVLGHLYASKGYRYHNIIGQMMSDRALREDVTEVLEQWFGIPAAVGEETIEQFIDDYHARTREEESASRVRR